MPIRLVATELATTAARAYTETNAGAADAACVAAVAHAVLASVDIWSALAVRRSGARHRAADLRMRISIGGLNGLTGGDFGGFLTFGQMAFLDRNAVRGHCQG